MQADAFLFQELVGPGDVVVVEAPSYDRTLLSLRKLGAEILAIPLEEDGIDVEAFERALEAGARPRLAHLIPNFHNPAGCTLSLEKRRRLVELADEYEFVLFEDDPYGELRFEGESLPRCCRWTSPGRWSTPRRSPRPSAPASGSATWRARRPHRRDPQARDRDLHLTEHGLPVDRRRVLPLGRDRQLDRDGQGGAARAPRRRVRRAGARLPDARFVLPQGGYFLWVDLPEGTDGEALESGPRERGVIFVKGTDFLLEGGENSFRIAYSGVKPDQIAEGVARIADAYRSVAPAAA